MWLVSFKIGYGTQSTAGRMYRTRSYIFSHVVDLFSAGREVTESSVYAECTGREEQVRGNWITSHPSTIFEEKTSDSGAVSFQHHYLWDPSPHKDLNKPHLSFFLRLQEVIIDATAQSVRLDQPFTLTWRTAAWSTPSAASVFPCSWII